MPDAADLERYAAHTWVGGVLVSFFTAVQTQMIASHWL